MNASSWFPRLRTAWLLPAVVMLLPACMSPAAASTSTHSMPHQCSVTRMVPVRGRLVSLGERTVARIDAIPSRDQPALGGPVEMYFPAYPTEEFDAFVSGVTAASDGSLTAEADIAHADARLIPDLPFTAQMVVDAPCPRRNEIRSRRDPFIGEIVKSAEGGT